MTRGDGETPSVAQSPRSRVLARIGCGLLVVVVVLGIVGSLALRKWWGAEVVASAEALPPLSEEFRLKGVRLPAHGALPSEDVESWAGDPPRAALFLCDMRAISNPRAMAWATAIGEAIVESASLRVGAVRAAGIVEAPELPPLLRGPPTRMLTKFAAEFPFEMRLDFGGSVRRGFEFEDGGSGVVLIGDDQFPIRLGGALDATKRATVRRFFGLSESPPIERAPNLAMLLGVSDLRAPAPVAVVFLARAVSEREAPAFRSSPLGMLLSGFEPPADPSVRLLTFLAGARGNPKSAEIVIVGTLEGFANQSWRRVADRPEVRSALGVIEGAAAIVAIDETGAVRVRAVGKPPMWRLGAAAEVLGLEPPGS